MSKGTRWSLFGAPDHQGVLNVGGRVGAARGPAVFRRRLARMTGKRPLSGSLGLDRLVDHGDLDPVDRDLTVAHRQAADRIRDAHRATGLSVIVGGGNDYAYPQLQGLAAATDGRVGAINIDAHFDLREPRPVASSGSPFRQAIEDGTLAPERLVEFGIQAHCNGPALWKYAESKKIDTVMLEAARRPGAFAQALARLATKCDVVVICLDLDAIASAYAPGVSAPQSDGFTPAETIEMMRIAGAHPLATSLGIFELNPDHDIDERTSILAATAAWNFVDAALNMGESSRS